MAYAPDIDNRTKFTTVDHVATIVEQIRSIEGLEEIRLSGNTFGVEAALAIAAALKDQAQLKVNKLQNSCLFTTLLNENAHIICIYKSIQFADIFTGRILRDIQPAVDAFVDALVGKVPFYALGCF